MYSHLNSSVVGGVLSRIDQQRHRQDLKVQPSDTRHCETKVAGSINATQVRNSHLSICWCSNDGLFGDAVCVRRALEQNSAFDLHWLTIDNGSASEGYAVEVDARDTNGFLPISDP